MYNGRDGVGCKMVGWDTKREKRSGKSFMGHSGRNTETPTKDKELSVDSGGTDALATRIYFSADRRIARPET